METTLHYFTTITETTRWALEEMIATLYDDLAEVEGKDDEGDLCEELKAKIHDIEKARRGM